jgi:Tol biopolymer transport system component
MTSSTPFCSPAVRRLRHLAPALVLLLALVGCGSDAPNPVRPGSSGPKLLIAVDTDRPPSPNGGYDLYFYDVASGAPAFRPPNLNTIFDESTSGFSADGHWLVFNSTRQLTGTQAQIFLYDIRTGNTFVPDAPRAFQGAQNPALSGNGSRMAFHYQIGFDFFDLTIGLVDAVADTVIPTPSLHAPLAGEFDPSLSADGSLIACTTTRDGSLDVLLYSVPGDSIIPLIGLNTGYSETGVSISGNGRYIAFHSNRPGGSGLFDLYVYDRQLQTLLPLPGANTALSELNPSLSNDGRYVAYTSENDGASDIRLYDIQAQRLVPVPGLNDSYYIDRFPSLTVAN